MSDERVGKRYDDEEFEAHKLTPPERAGDGGTEPEKVDTEKVDDEDFEGHQLTVDKVTDI